MAVVKQGMPVSALPSSAPASAPADHSAGRNGPFEAGMSHLRTLWLVDSQRSSAVPDESRRSGRISNALIDWSHKWWCAGAAPAPVIMLR